MRLSHSLAIVFWSSVMWSVVSAHAPAADVRWQSVPKTAFDTANREQRPMLVYFTADYCTFCRKLEATTWTHPEVTRRIADEFVPLKVDGERLPQLVAALRVDGFPAVVIVAPNGEEVGRVTGYVAPDQMLAALNKAAEKSRARMAALRTVPQ